MSQNENTIAKNYNFEMIFIETYNYLKAYVTLLVSLFLFFYYSNTSKMRTFTDRFPFSLISESMGIDYYGKNLFRKQQGWI